MSTRFFSSFSIYNHNQTSLINVDRFLIVYVLKPDRLKKTCQVRDVNFYRDF